MKTKSQADKCEPSKYYKLKDGMIISILDNKFQVNIKK